MSECVFMSMCVCVHLQQVKSVQVNLSLDPLSEVCHIGVDAGAQDLRETHRPPRRSNHTETSGRHPPHRPADRRCHPGETHTHTHDVT